jgi:putative membrane protein
MLPTGFLGTRGDILMDIVIVSLVAVVPIVLYSWSLARRKEWATHKAFQLATGIGLGVVVLIFELDLRLMGGIFEATKLSAYAGTFTLNAWIWIHIILALSTTVTWAVLLIASVRKFPKPPMPNAFSARHRLWGRVAMVLMLGTGVTSLPVYIYGFAL